MTADRSTAVARYGGATAPAPAAPGLSACSGLFAVPGHFAGPPGARPTGALAAGVGA